MSENQNSNSRINNGKQPLVCLNVFSSLFTTFPSYALTPCRDGGLLMRISPTIVKLTIQSCAEETLRHSFFDRNLENDNISQTKQTQKITFIVFHH